MDDSGLSEKISRFVESLKIEQTKKDRWFSEMEIRVFWEDGVAESNAKEIVGKTLEFIEKQSIGFKVIDRGVNPNSTENIQASIFEGLIDAYYLSSFRLKFEPWRYEKGNQHGDIMIIKTRMVQSESFSSFDDGAIIINENSPEMIERELRNLFGGNYIGTECNGQELRQLWNAIAKKLEN